jgi:hypothetical protein
MAQLFSMKDSKFSPIKSLLTSSRTREPTNARFSSIWIWQITMPINYTRPKLDRHNPCPNHKKISLLIIYSENIRNV